MSNATHPRLDATADLYVNVIDADVACATPRDHCNCAVAQAIKRAIGRADAEATIYPSVAYVLMPADALTIRENRMTGLVKRGQLAWHRFRISPELGAQILSFDETGEAKSGGYRFRAPTASQRLAYKREHARPTLRPGTRSVQARMPWRRSAYFRTSAK